MRYFSFFFFSSRRRHTRCGRDWSSDVCSSDLDQSLRMIVHTSIGGDAVRVKLTNACGSTPLEIGAATVGIRDDGASVRSPVRRLRFNGQRSVAVAAGATVTSDPVDLTVPALSDLAITLYLPTATLP